MQKKRKNISRTKEKERKTMSKPFKKVIMIGTVSASIVLGACSVFSAYPIFAGEMETLTEAPIAPLDQTYTENMNLTQNQTEPPLQTETVPQEPAETDVSRTEDSDASGKEDLEPLTDPEKETQQQTESEKNETEIPQNQSESNFAKEYESIDEYIDLDSESEEEESESEPESETDINGDPVLDPELAFSYPVNPNNYPLASQSEITNALYSYLKKDINLNHAAACGVLANVHLESCFNLFALGDGGTSYGLCQWHNGRWTALRAFCASEGYDPDTLLGQARFMEYELSTGYSNVYNYLLSIPNTAQGAYDAASYFCTYYEAPNETALRARQRGNLAKNEYFPKEYDILPNYAEIIAKIRERLTLIPKNAISEIRESDEETDENKKTDKVVIGYVIRTISPDGEVDVQTSGNIKASETETQKTDK